MAITTYSELQAAVKNWLHRGDLDARIPEFIALGEARISRLLRVPALRASATITPSQAVRYVALPARYRELVSFTDDEGDQVQVVSSALLEAAAYDASAGRPEYCHISSRIDFERIADASYAFTMMYWQSLDLAGDSTNVILDTYPDIYLYASLIASAPFLRNDERVVTWNELFRTALAEANAEVRSHALLRTDLATEGAFDIRSG